MDFSPKGILFHAFRRADRTNAVIGRASRRRQERQQWIREALSDYERPLMRYATRLLGDSEQAREVVQDTFLRLCQQERSRISDHIAEWLFTVCRNRALDVLRKETPMNPMPQAQIDAHPSREPSPAQRLEVKEGLTRISKMLSMLPQNQQEVVRLKFQENLSYREIGRVTGLSETNVGFLLHTALKTVRERLQREDETAQQRIRRVK